MKTIALLVMRCFTVAFMILLARYGGEAQAPIKERSLRQRNLGTISRYQHAKQEGIEFGESASVVFVDSKTIAITYRVQSVSAPVVRATNGIFARCKFRYGTGRVAVADNGLVCNRSGFHSRIANPRR